MREFPRPKVVISKCIEFDHCRFNGQIILSDFVDAIKPFVDFWPVCPEVEIGLGVPRDSIRIVSMNNELRLVQPATGLDVTEKIIDFADSFLKSHQEADGFILKFRSPSCGINEVRVYSGLGKSGAIKKTAGFFGRAVLKANPGAAIEDEGRLRNLKIRVHFLTKLYALASFHDIDRVGSISDLIRFHNDNKLLLLAHSQAETKILGSLVADGKDSDFKELMKSYEEHLVNGLSKPAKCTGNIIVMAKAMGYFSDELSESEKDYFLGILNKYKNRRVPLSAPMSVLREWVVRFDDDYLRSQTFFEPYPEDLLEICGGGSEPDSRRQDRKNE